MKNAKLMALYLVGLCAAAALTACNRPSSINEKRYQIAGKVIAVNKTERTATVNHETIPGYMESMTMDFNVKSDADLDRIKPGDRISGTLVVTDDSSWIEISAIMEGSSEVTPTTTVPGEPKPGDDVPDFTLVNQDGKPIRLSQYKGKALALTFIYTRCPDPDQCTLMSANFAAIDKELARDSALETKTRLLSITFDPDYDTPKVLRSYGASHTGRLSEEKFQRWEFATGTRDEIKKVAQYFGVRYFRESESSEEKVIHSLRTAVIDPQGKLVKLYRGNEWRPEEVASDLRTLAAGAK